MAQLVVIAAVILAGILHGSSAQCNNVKTLNGNGTFYTPTSRGSIISYQTCEWRINASRSQAAIIDVLQVNSGSLFESCSEDYLQLPNGFKLCGDAPRNCFSYVASDALGSSCLMNVPQCHCSMQIYKLSNWPPLITFRSRQRKNYRSFTVNYTIVDCATSGNQIQPEVTEPDVIEPDVTEPDAIDTTTITEENQANSLIRSHLTAFTVMAVISAFLLLAVFILVKMLLNEKRKNCEAARRLTTLSVVPPTERIPPTERPPPVLPSTLAVQERNYSNSFAADNNSVSYDYIQPTNAHHYEDPTCIKPVYVEIH